MNYQTACGARRPRVLLWYGDSVPIPPPPEQVFRAASRALPLPDLPAALLQQDVVIYKAKGQQEIPTSAPPEHGGSRGSSVTQSRCRAPRLLRCAPLLTLPSPARHPPAPPGTHRPRWRRKSGVKKIKKEKKKARFGERCSLINNLRQVPGSL